MRTIDEYIAAAPEAQRAALQEIRETIRAAAPEAEECISYAMPAFRQGKVLIYFASAKHHIGIYPTASGMTAFAERLAGYETSKGAIRLPLGEPIPHELIADIVGWRLCEV